MSKSLKLCPFCGGEAAAFEQDFPEKKLYSVACLTCMVTTSLYSTVTLACDAWNRRTKDE